MNKITVDMLGIEPNTEVSIIGYNGVNIEVKSVLGFSETLAFVNIVTNACFDENTGEYMPEIRDYATRFAIFRMYTNVELPSDSNDCYPIVYELDDLLAEVMDNINELQFSAIDRAISAKIGDIVESKTNETKRKFDDLYNAILNLTNQFAELFGEISEDDIKDIISSLQSAGFDENKFVETYMKNYKTSE